MARLDHERSAAASVPSPVLGDEEAHLWVVGPEAVADADALIGSLSRAERDRAARFLREGDRHRFVVAHAVLRSLLGRLAGVEPAGVAFVAGVRGGTPECLCERWR